MIRTTRPSKIGYFVKKTALRPDFIENPVVVEIGSVSTCISEAPPKRLSTWNFNEYGLFETEEEARQLIDDDSEEYDLYAYELYPFSWDEGRVTPIPVSSQEIDLSGYLLLGFDIVSRSGDVFFECSPLSCNRAADTFTVNRYCLIDDPDYAEEVCRTISAGRYEPGPYYLVRVYRRSKVGR